MHILVIGSGGREHALVWALAKSSHCETIWCIPGNGGTHDIAQTASIDVNDFAAVADFCKKQEIELVVVGPEAPLVDGIVDHLEAAGIPTFGPSKAAAQLEGSKKFTKELCNKYSIPTAAYESFTESEPAKEYIRTQGTPIVVKADGLAAGKGVIIAQSEDEAFAAVDEILGGKFGDAGNTLVIEEFLDGEEASFFALADGEHVIAFGSAQDHKRVGEGDTGPNTGGMGTYSPAPIITDAMHETIMQTIILPTIAGMKADGAPFRGFLFAGLMIDENGPKLLEFNTRFGDPEAQVLMPRLESDLAELCLAGCKGTLDQQKVALRNHTALCVVMAANGYPGSYEKGTIINKLDETDAQEDTIIFHAGTKREGNQILANGGRVLGVTALGKDVIEAQQKAYKAVDLIDWPEGFCRRDIGWRAVKKLEMAS